MQLLNWQKIDLFQKIKSVGFDPLSFELVQPTTSFSTLVPEHVTIKHKESPFYCNIVQSAFDSAFTLTFSPGFDSYTATERAITWTDTVRYIDLWLANIKSELSLQDPWEALKTAMPEANNLPLDNTPFSPDEVAALTQEVETLRLEFNSYAKGSQTKLGIIQNQMDYLIETLPTAGKVDWTNQIASAVISLGMNLAMDVEKIKFILAGVSLFVLKATSVTPELMHSLNYLTR